MGADTIGAGGGGGGGGVSGQYWNTAEPLNPNERKRTATHAAVGLKNVGNTCYVNSLLQMYYLIPQFRHRILNAVDNRQAAWRRRRSAELEATGAKADVAETDAGDGTVVDLTGTSPGPEQVMTPLLERLI